jgi:hypothetical protein
MVGCAVECRYVVKNTQKKQMTKFVTELIIGIFAKDSASPQGLVGDILDSMKAVA